MTVVTPLGPFRGLERYEEGDGSDDGDGNVMVPRAGTVVIFVMVPGR